MLALGWEQPHGSPAPIKHATWSSSQLQFCWCEIHHTCKCALRKRSLYTVNRHDVAGDWQVALVFIVCLLYHAANLLEDDDDLVLQPQDSGPSTPLEVAGNAIAHARPAAKLPRVRWLPLRRPRLPRGGSLDGYCRAAASEMEAPICSSDRFEIGGASSEDGGSENSYGGGDANGGWHGQTLTVRAVVPIGGETAFRSVLPSGAQVGRLCPDHVTRNC